MHILYIHQHFCTPDGSTGTRSYEFAKKLVSRGHQVTMVCGSFQMAKTGLTNEFKKGVRQGNVDGFNVIEIDVSYSNYDGFSTRLKRFALFALRASKIALTLKYDVVFATSTPLTAALPGILAKTFRRKRFIFEVRDLWPELPRAMGIIKSKTALFLLSGFESIAYRLADQCVGLSPGIVEGIKTKLPRKDKSKVYFLPNGCDISFFRSFKNNRLVLPVNANDFVAVFTGAHGKANGLDAAIDAARLLQERGNDRIKLIFVGNGGMKPSLIEAAQGLSNCIFMDPLPKKELRSLLVHADLGLMLLANVPAFYYGTSPNKFFDYIASGLPVLVNYPGWLSKLIKKYNIGISISPDEPVTFADALQYMASLNKPVLAKMSEASVKLSESFSRDKISNEFASLISDGNCKQDSTSLWECGEVA